MSLATLKKSRVEGAEFTEDFEVDCEHGTTHIYLTMPLGAVKVSDFEASAMAVAKHYDEEHCRCTRKLRKRFNV